MSSVNHHVCPEPNFGMMPMVMQQYASNGSVDKVLSWLEKGGDINAADMNNATLVHIACGSNRVGLLKKLLEYPDVHLNQICNQHHQVFTPLAQAIRNGNVECMEILLNAQSTCQISFNKGYPEYSLIKVATTSGKIQPIHVLLKHGYVLDENEAVDVLQVAVKFGELSLIIAVSEQNFPISCKTKYSFKEIYQMNLWSENAMEVLFKRAVENKNDYSLEVLGAVLAKRDWNILESLLKIVQGKMILSIDLAESALARDTEKVKKLLAEPENLTEDFLNGVLLVVAIGGTSEEVMEVIFDQELQYPLGILDKSLILACIHENIDVLVSLFKKNSFSLTILDRASVVASRSCIENLIKHAVKRAIQETLPLHKLQVAADEKEDN